MSNLRARSKATAEQKDAWATPKYWIANVGYGGVSAASLLGSSRAAVVLWLPEDATAEAPAHALPELAAVAQRVLLADNTDDAADEPPSVVVVLDLSPLVDAAGAAAALDVEGRSVGTLGAVAKPTARALDKMVASGMSELTLVACGGAAQLLLRLLSGRASERGVRPGAVRRAVLVHPRLPGPCVNAHLGGAAASGGAGRLDVLFESVAAMERRLAALRHAYPQGGVAIGTVGAGQHQRATLLAHALSVRPFVADAATEAEVGVRGGGGGGGGDVPVAPLEAFDAERMDGVGRTLWLSRLRFEISRATKQHEAYVDDASATLEALPPLPLNGALPPPPTPTGVTASAPRTAEAAAAASAAAAQAAPPASRPAAASGSGPVATASGVQDVAADATAAPVEYGAVVLRGNRCVLVRSLAKPKPLWSGMAIPSLPPKSRGESALDAARRAACKWCEIDWPEELLQLPQLPPACVYRADGRGGCSRTEVHALYTSQPPPPGPLEDADAEDEDDCYDWYTFPRAMAALAHDPPAAAALRTLACALAAAAAAGAVPHKWGGVFGQEWTSQLGLGGGADGGMMAGALGGAGGAGAGAGAASKAWTPIEFKFCALRPFAPARLHEALEALADASWPGSAGDPTTTEAASSASASASASASSASSSSSAAAAADGDGEDVARAATWLTGRVRSLKGVAWMATQPDLQASIGDGTPGRFTVEPGNPWWASQPRDKWPEGLAADLEAANLWHEPHGDRQTELVASVVSADDQKWLEGLLEGALLTEAEMAEGLHKWCDGGNILVDDPYAEAWEAVLRAESEWFVNKPVVKAFRGFQAVQRKEGAVTMACVAIRPPSVD